MLIVGWKGLTGASRVRHLKSGSGQKFLLSTSTATYGHEYLPALRPARWQHRACTAKWWRSSQAGQLNCHAESCLSLLFLTEMPRPVSRLPSWLLQFMLPWPRIELKSSCKNFFLRNLAPGHNHKLAQLKTLKVCQEIVYRCIQYGLPHAFCLPAAALSNIALSQCKRLASDCRVGHLKRLNKNGWQCCSVWRSGQSRNRFYLKLDLNSTTSATHVYTCYIHLSIYILDAYNMDVCLVCACIYGRGYVNTNDAICKNMFFPHL